MSHSENVANQMALSMEQQKSKALSLAINTRIAELGIPLSWASSVHDKPGRDVLSVWQTHSMPAVLDENETLIPFRFTTPEDINPSKLNDYIHATEDEMENQDYLYGEIYAAMNDVVATYASVSCRLKELQKLSIYAKYSNVEVATTTLARIKNTVLQGQDKAGHCIQELGGKDNFMAIVRQMESIARYISQIHSALLKGKYVRVGNIGAYTGFTIPVQENNFGEKTGGEYYSPLHKKDQSRKYTESSLTDLISYLTNMSVALHAVNGILKKYIEAPKALNEIPEGV